MAAAGSGIALEGGCMETIGNPLLWGVFVGVVILALALDLFVFHRRAHDVSFREALTWTFVWIGLSLAFNLWIYFDQGRGPALEFLTGYVIEKALSVDNIFVFLVIFDYFGIPNKYQHRVLFWGILGAVVTRGIFVVLGAALISRFHWIIFVFGLFLVFTGVRIMVRDEDESKVEHNPIIRFFERHLRTSPRLDGQKFFTLENGRRVATPLLLVLLVVEATDVVFAVDSIPAIFAITTDPFLVYTSNIFAILGLRALYFVLADLMDRFAYLRYGLGSVLVFVGIKMLIAEWVEIPTSWSLAVVAILLGGSAALSWRRGAQPPDDAETGTPS